MSEEHEYMALRDAFQLSAYTVGGAGWELHQVTHEDILTQVNESVPVLAQPPGGYPSSVATPRNVVIRVPIYIVRKRRDAHTEWLATELRAAQDELRKLKDAAAGVAKDIVDGVPKVG